MEIIKERTRIIFSDYNASEKNAIEDMVATMDKVFTYEDSDKHMICLPTGMENATKRLFPRHNIMDKSKEYWPYNNMENYEITVSPRNQLQKDFISFMLDNMNKKQKSAGILSVGSGKTFMACYCATKFRAKTLIIVPTSAIKFQWADTLTGMFKIPKDRVVTINAPTQFINVNADFVIVSQASLASLNKSYDLEKIMKDNRFGFKVIDEVQMWFHNIIKVDGCSNIANNLYLTGTFGRSGEEENRLYQEMFGDISIFREKEKKPTLFDRKPGNIYGMKPHTNFKMYWGNSRLPNDLMKKVTSAWKYSDRSDKWTRIGINMAAYVKIVFPDDGHNTPLMQALFKIIQIALNEINYGKTLILMPSIASAEMVANYMRQRYPNLKTGTLHSKNPKSVNVENKKSCDCLVSTVPSAGTGFDWKGLSRLINASPYKSWIIATQVRGRLRILDSGKDTYMYELVDARIPQLRRWANVRSQVYRKECKTFKVIDMK